MRATSDWEVSGYQPGSPRERLVSTVLSATIVVLALLVALYQTQIAPRLEKRANPVSFDVTGDQSDAGAKTPEKRKQPEKHKARKEQQPRVRTQAPVPPVEQPVAPEKPAFTFLKMSRADMAAADIGSMKRPGASGGEAASSGSTYGPGEGPGGATLYNADWFKKPTDAELGGYLPSGIAADGWGMIACQTIEHYRVDNCQILGESPRGSGLARAVLNAAWQFQVVPPRVNGKPQLGVWVRIRIDYGTKRPMPG